MEFGSVNRVTYTVTVEEGEVWVCTRLLFRYRQRLPPPISYVKKRLNFKRLSLSAVLIIIIMFLRTPSPLCVFRNRFFGKLESPVVFFFWFCGGARFGIELHVGSPPWPVSSRVFHVGKKTKVSFALDCLRRVFVLWVP